MHAPDPGPGYERRSLELLGEPGLTEAVTGGTLSFVYKQAAAYAAIDAPAWRDWARRVKDHLLSDLAGYLEQAERRLTARGVCVHWAETSADVHRVLTEVVARRGVRRLVKAKSMLSEEVAVNEHLERLGVEVFETDLGQYIIQLLGEHPSHVVIPAIHRDLAAIRRLFHERFGTPLDGSPDTLAAAARSVLRNAFLTADLGMSGANFLVAETGTIALIENEGNIRLSTSAPPVHLALVGIERLIPRLSDLSAFLQLTARAALGMPIGTFVSLIQGPRTAADPDGPEEVHVVFVDNGRSRLLADPVAWEVLRCVRCGACQNSCPVFRQTGGQAYGWTYGGPIGSILAPGLLGLAPSHPLPYASTLCGACAEVCPVNIPIPDLLLEWRRRCVEAGLTGGTERAALRLWRRAMTSPGRYRTASRLARMFKCLGRSRRLPLLGKWVQERGPLEPDKVAFHRQIGDLDLESAEHRSKASGQGEEGAS
jgi:L-lactate dehydrogenase complex protein LldF